MLFIFENYSISSRAQHYYKHLLGRDYKSFETSSSFMDRAVYILKAILIRETKKVVQLLIQTSVWGASWDRICLFMRLSGESGSKLARFGVDDGRLFNN